MILMPETAKVPSLGSRSWLVPDPLAAGPFGAPGGPPRIPLNGPWSGVEVGAGVAATGRLVCRMITVIFEALMLGTGWTAYPCTSPVVWSIPVLATSLKRHVSRLSTRCCSHGSPPEPCAGAVSPGMMLTAVMT
jgi:hypothetical protein